MIAVEKVCVTVKPAATLKDLPDTYPWADVLKVACKDTDVARAVMKLKLPTGALFAGPAGNGRHTTAQALAGSLCTKTNRYVGCCKIYGGDLDVQEERQLVPLLEYIAKKAIDGGLVLIVDQPELCKYSQFFQRGLLRCQEAFEQNGAELFLIVITAGQENLMGELLGRFPLYPCVPPEESIVRKWVSQMMKNPVPIKVADMGNVEIVDALTGLSWRQLTDCHSHLLRLIVLRFSQNRKQFEKKGVDEETAYRDGLITLSREDVLPLLESLRLPRPQEPVFFTQGMAQPVVEESLPTVEEMVEAEPSASVGKVYSDEEVAALFNV